MNAGNWDRIAGDYYSEVISPLKDSEQNPLFKDLKRLSGKKLSVADLGCGTGELIPLLSKGFARVLALDFSEEMIAKASERAKGLKNVECKVADISKEPGSKEEFDVVVSVNSVLSPKVRTVGRIIDNINAFLKPSGTLLAVFPAIEAYVFDAMLVMEEKLGKGYSEKRASESAHNNADLKSFDFVRGVIDFEGESQKAFYRFELLYRFENAGFESIEVGRVFYSWESWRNAGGNYFPGKPMPWDWYLTARKPAK